MRRYSTCIWCEKNDSPPSAEDIFARWIARKWPGHKKSHFHAEGFFIPDDGSPERKEVEFGAVGGFGLLTRGACKRCNNEFMSDIETAVAPFLTPLITGTPTKIESHQALWLARWAFKTSVMYEWREAQRRDSPRYFKPRDRREFFNTLMIPSHLWVFAGHYIGDGALWTCDIPTAMNVHFDGERHDFPAYALTFAIGQLALHVFSFRWPVQSRATQIAFKLPRIFRDATIELYPRIGNSRWPPEVKFDRAGMMALANTWRRIPL